MQDSSGLAADLERILARLGFYSGLSFTEDSYHGAVKLSPTSVGTKQAEEGEGEAGKRKRGNPALQDG